jgi:hypothetical protein
MNTNSFYLALDLVFLCGCVVFIEKKDQREKLCLEERDENCEKVMQV